MEPFGEGHGLRCRFAIFEGFASKITSSSPPSLMRSRGLLLTPRRLHAFSDLEESQPEDQLERLQAKSDEDHLQTSLICLAVVAKVSHHFLRPSGCCCTPQRNPAAGGTGSTVSVPHHVQLTHSVPSPPPLCHISRRSLANQGHRFKRRQQPRFLCTRTPPLAEHCLHSLAVVSRHRVVSHQFVQWPRISGESFDSVSK